MENPKNEITVTILTKPIIARRETNSQYRGAVEPHQPKREPKSNSAATLVTHPLSTLKCFAKARSQSSS